MNLETGIFIFCHNKISIIPLNYFRISLQFIRSDKTNSLIIKFKNCTHRTPKTEYNGVNTLFYRSLRCSRLRELHSNEAIRLHQRVAKFTFDTLIIYIVSLDLMMPVSKIHALTPTDCSVLRTIIFNFSRISIVKMEAVWLLLLLKK